MSKLTEASLDLVLEQRERRVSIINELQKEFPQYAILSFKLNIPGPIKNTDNYQWAFKQGLDAIDEDIVKKIIEKDNITGPEAFLVINSSALELKKRMITIENNHPLGRLYDLDVIGVDRSQLSMSPRKCLICDDIAYACSRSRKHSLEAVVEKINNMILEHM